MGSIKGIVRDINNIPLEDVNMVILDGPSHPDISSTTGVDGTFSFSGLRLGNYTIKAFSSVASDDIPVRVLAGKIAFVEIWMETNGLEKEDNVVDEM